MKVYDTIVEYIESKLSDPDSYLKYSEELFTFTGSCSFLFKNNNDEQVISTYFDDTVEGTLIKSQPSIPQFSSSHINFENK